MPPLAKSSLSIVLGISLFTMPPSRADDDLMQLSLEELLSVQVTSVSKKSQSLFEAAAAIHVITREDIQRSGMTSIPELLRLVPGMHVARIGSNKWAISSRGFSDRRANKLLVLMDGRTLYTPLYSGVYWDVQDTPLDDIERIEVILGPGSTLWGANAVNGVINIITRNSNDTQGGLVVARAGDEEKGVTLRYGGTLGKHTALRAYVKFREQDRFTLPDGNQSYDAWDNRQAGFRADWEPSGRDTFTLQGDIYSGNHEDEIFAAYDLNSAITRTRSSADNSGGNLLLRWKQTRSGDSEWEFQVYYDYAERNDAILG